MAPPIRYLLIFAFLFGVSGGGVSHAQTINTVISPAPARQDHPWPPVPQAGLQPIQPQLPIQQTVTPPIPTPTVDDGLEPVQEPLQSTQDQPPQSPVRPLLIDALDANRLGYDIGWTTDLGVPQDQIIEHVQVYGDILVTIEAPSNLVSAVSIRDGSLIWSHVVGSPSDHLFAPVRHGDVLLINSDSLLFTVRVKDGKVLATTRLDTSVNNAPAVIGQHAIFGSINHRVLAINIKDGFTRWAYQLTAPVFVQPILLDNYLFAADGNGIYAMFTADTGQLLWKSKTFDRISAPPVMDGQSVFVASEDGSLYALQRATGRDRWIFRTTEILTDSPRIIGSAVYLLVPNQGLIAIDIRTGSTRWQTSSNPRPLALMNDALVAHFTTNMVLLEPESGQTLFEAPVVPLQTVLVTPDQQLILVTMHGRMLLLRPRTNL